MPPTRTQLLEEPLPWLPWHWQRFRNDVRLSRAPWQLRAFFKELWEECWVTGGVPDDPARCAFVVGCSFREMEEMWPQLRELFDVELPNGTLTNSILEQLRTERDHVRLVNRKNAAKGGRAKALNQLDLLAGESEAEPDGSATVATASDALGETEKEVEKENRVKTGTPDLNNARTFADAWAIYPSRGSHSNPRKLAEAQWNARIKQARQYRYTPAQMANALYAGTERYAKYCDAIGRTGTEFVLQGATFFGKNERWREAYATTNGKQVNGTSAREHRAVDAARQFLGSDSRSNTEEKANG